VVVAFCGMLDVTFSHQPVLAVQLPLMRMSVVAVQAAEVYAEPFAGMDAVAVTTYRPVLLEGYPSLPAVPAGP
jgi:hypothetical protein